MIEQRKIRLRLIALGHYSKALVLPKWWVKLNDDPEEVDIDLSFGLLSIQPVGKEDGGKVEARSDE